VIDADGDSIDTAAHSIEAHNVPEVETHRKQTSPSIPVNFTCAAQAPVYRLPAPCFAL
jgi:hypothetical protein